MHRSRLPRGAARRRRFRLPATIALVAGMSLSTLSEAQSTSSGLTLDPPPVTAHNAEVTDVKGLSLDELMNVEVTLVSRRPEKVAETASAITVLTGEDIRRSG